MSNGLDGIKNEKQVYYNFVKGVITELNDGERFCSVTLLVGHETKRYINLIVKKENFDWVISNFAIGNKISATFYLTSRNKMGKWYTMATIIDLKNIEAKQDYQNL